MALVMLISRGQHSTQLKTVRQRQTPIVSFMISSRSFTSWSRLSKMKRCAWTIAAGPTYSPLAQKDGQEVVQQAQRMHLVVSSKRSRSATV